MWSARKLPPRLTKKFRLSQFNRACVRRAMRTLSSGATADICCSARWKAPNDRQGTDASRATPSRSPRDLVYRSCWEEVHNSPMEEQHQRMRRNTFIGAMALLDANVDGTLLTPPNPPKRTSHLGKTCSAEAFSDCSPLATTCQARLFRRFFLKGGPCGLGLSEGIVLEDGVFCLWMRSLYPSSAHVSCLCTSTVTDFDTSPVPSDSITSKICVLPRT